MRHLLPSLMVLMSLCVGADTLELPGLGPAVELAVNILELAQDIKDTHDDCKTLALRAARFTNEIYQQLNDSPIGVDVSSSTKHLATLLCTLTDIENLMKRQSKKREKILLIVRKDKVKQQVAELNRRLDDAFRLFGVQSSIAVEGRLEQIATTQVELVQHTENSARVSGAILKRQDSIKQGLAQIDDHLITLMRSVTMIFSKEEISLVRELDLSQEAAVYEDSVPESERIVRWQARIRSTKESVVVAKFPRRDERFRAAIELSKSTMHPHVAQILGYSRPDCEHAFVVLEGLQDQRPLEDFIKSVHGIKKYTWTAEVAKELQSAFTYIARQGFLKSVETDGDNIRSDTVGPHQLYVTPEGTVRWDIYSWTKDALPICVNLSDGYIEVSHHFAKLIEGFSTRDLERALESPVPIQRARALLNLWDKLMEFTDFNREKFYCFVPDEDVPWIGSCTQYLAFEALTPEGVMLQHTINPAAVRCDRSFGKPHCYPFEEDEPETEYTNVPTDLYVHEIYAPNMQEYEMSVPTRVSKTKTFPGWRRHTVLDMDYDVCFRTLQSIEEETKCRSFFMDQAVNLDFSRYLDRNGDVMMECDNEDFLPTVVYGLHFITTSHLVSLSPMRFGSPPRKLYFYERLHDAKNVIDFETPWGYWSTEAKPIRNFPGYEPPREEMRRFIKTQKLEIQYLGYSREFKFAWLQSVAGFVFRIEVMVAVESFHWTNDERLLLRELQQSLAAAYASNPGSNKWEIRKSVRRKRDEGDDGEQDRGEGRVVQRRRLE
ncbi:hypothetical protein ONZ51_g4981 [Trametes cubensis]|uniref:Protein kinase domain-containing protein n=1 Tax=Trametes cubensis TaxID=1111947 RepID=A0AAD7TVW2_9APHY|nr:hypothetical protein ONZ51_g4981 [Trametes cubensis]